MNHFAMLRDKENFKLCSFEEQKNVFVRYLQVLGIDTTSLLHNLLAIDGSPAPSPWD